MKGKNINRGSQAWTQDMYQAFCAGVASTREGFNGECLFDNCAPMTVTTHDVRKAANDDDVKRLFKMYHPVLVSIATGFWPRGDE